MHFQVLIQTQKFDVGTKRAAPKMCMLNLGQVQAESQKDMAGKTMTVQSSLKTGVGKHEMCGYRLGYPPLVGTWCVNIGPLGTVPTEHGVRIVLRAQPMHQRIAQEVRPQ